MANANSPFGLRPVKTLSGGGFVGKTMRCYVPSTDGTALYVGDPVLWAGTADASGEAPTVTACTAGATNKIFGIITGFDLDPSNLTYTYRPASTARYVHVLVPTASDVFEVQDDGSAVLAITSVGSNACLVAGSGGSTTSGLSSWMLDATTPGSDATYQVTVVGVSTRPDNEVGAVYCKWLVTINLMSLFPGVAALAV